MHLRPLTRSVVLALTVALTACTPEEPPAATQPLDFSYLTPLPLNVAILNVESQYVPSGMPPDVSHLDPISPVQALEQMAQQRLKPVGPSGQAVFTVNDASMVQTGNAITGVMSVTLSIYPSPGVRAGYAQATVTRQVSGVEGDLSAPLADLTRNLIDQMNVEFEYRVRQALGRWVMSAGATATPVQQVPLQPPGSPYAAPPPPMPPLGSQPPGYQPPAYQPPGYQPPGYQPPGYQPPGAAGLPVPLSPPGSLPEPVTQPPPPEPSFPYTPPPPASMAPSVTPPASPPLPYTPPPAAPLPQPGPPAAPPSPGLPPLGPVQD